MKIVDYSLELIDSIREETSLETRLKVLNEMFFINLLSELGYREDKMWTSDENEMLEKICNLALKLAKYQIDDINEYLGDIGSDVLVE